MLVANLVQCNSQKSQPSLGNQTSGVDAAPFSDARKVVDDLPPPAPSPLVQSQQKVEKGGNRRPHANRLADPEIGLPSNISDVTSDTERVFRAHLTLEKGQTDLEPQGSVLCDGNDERRRHPVSQRHDRTKYPERTRRSDWSCPSSRVVKRRVAGGWHKQTPEWMEAIACITSQLKNQHCEDDLDHTFANLTTSQRQGVRRRRRQALLDATKLQQEWFQRKVSDISDKFPVLPETHVRSGKIEPAQDFTDACWRESTDGFDTWIFKVEEHYYRSSKWAPGTVDIADKLERVGSVHRARFHRYTEWLANRDLPATLRTAAALQEQDNALNALIDDVRQRGILEPLSHEKARRMVSELERKMGYRRCGNNVGD